ncbi:hypothetical protein BRARA_E01791 [Brassica rapa]|uniref:Uncharacterized protein n=1 Tax=Brassica campestris TaxID=3711 RepID=A0A397ZH76_BRACM|nr:hypothetical protein BRARA_E01791 [Brassica rapa]
MSFHGGDVGTIMKATINSNRRPALSIKHSTFIQATVYQHLIKTGSIYSISGFDVTQSNLNLTLSDSSLSI